MGGSNDRDGRRRSHDVSESKLDYSTELKNALLDEK